jgi:predicted peroxiredoxin
VKKTLIAMALTLGSGLALAESQPVTLVLTEDDTMTQGIALVLANQMQEQGAQVSILLCDQAGDLALKDAGGEPLKPNNVTPAQLLDGAIKKGATASVCALYLPNTGHKPEDLKEGIIPAKPAEMGRALLEPNRKVFTF